MFAHFQEYHRNHEKSKKFIYLQPSVNKAIPPFFLFSIECISWFWVIRLDWKKNLTKKSQDVSE